MVRLNSRKNTRFERFQLTIFDENIAFLREIEIKNGDFSPIFNIRIFDYFGQNNRASIIAKCSNIRLFEYSNWKLYLGDI